MSRTRAVAIAVALLSFPNTSAWAASPRLGVAAVRTDGTACVTVKGEPLRSGDLVWIILFSPPRIVDGEILAKETSPCIANSTVEGVAYKVKLRFSFGAEEDLGIAVYAPDGRAEYDAGQFVIKTPGTQNPLSFRSCASSEGIHLTTWRGNRRTWHEYVYLGMDLQANCTEEEAGG